VVDEVSQATNASPAIITIRGDANGVVIENTREGSVGGNITSSAPRAAPRAPKDAQELEKILDGMGRDPTTGAALTPAAARKTESKPPTSQSGQSE
jgi:hypothetical protein